VTPAENVRAAAEIRAAVAAEGLLQPGAPVLVLLSGGQDSVCLAHLAVALAGPGAVTALHVDYGLRASSSGDAALCRDLCAALGVELEIRTPAARPAGNLQAWAREERYAAARALAAERRADVAAGHTASDQVETILYRLAAAPGRRALLGMQPRAGIVIRPLLAVSRAETEGYCREVGLPFATDPGNRSPRYARNRVRHRLLPALRDVHPAADANVLRTARRLRDEAEVLRAAVEHTRRALGGTPSVAELRALSPALSRLVIQDMADEVLGSSAPAIAERLEEILALAADGGTATLDVGAGLRAEVSYGRLRLVSGSAPAASPEPGWLVVPGVLTFGDGELTAERGAFPIGDGSLAAAGLQPRLEVRAWRTGDSMRPLGLGGRKSLQDLFTDRKVPRERRQRLPVVVSGGEIAWVPGVATSEAFRVPDCDEEHVRLSWTPPVYD
jgi:tRNA(Ile)-lysidine synthase